MKFNVGDFVYIIAGPFMGCSVCEAMKTGSGSIPFSGGLPTQYDDNNIKPPVTCTCKGPRFLDDPHQGACEIKKQEAGAT